MAAVEALVEVELVFEPGRPWSVTPYGDGCLLTAAVAGDTGLRHWQLEDGVGHITTDGDNVVTAVRVHALRRGDVEPAGGAGGGGGASSARMAWPAACSATVDAGHRCELAFDGTEPEQWLRLGDVRAWIATTADGRLARVVAEAPLPERERLAIRIDDGPFTAMCRTRFLIARWPGVGPPGWPRESLDGAASLALHDDGTLAALEVFGVEPGDVDAPTPGGVAPGELWLEWPAAVTARATTGVERTVSVRFGDAEPTAWTVLASGVALGAAADGRVLRLVLPRAQGPPPAPGVLGPPGVRAFDPLRELVALAESGADELTVYGLAGEKGTLGGRAGGPGGLDAVGLVFGDREGSFVEITSTRSGREPELHQALAGELASLEARESNDDDAYFEALEELEEEIAGAPLQGVPAGFEGGPVELRAVHRGATWGAFASLGESGVYLVGRGRGPEGLELERVHDLAPVVERFGREFRVPDVLPAPDERAAAAGAVVAGLFDALLRLEGAPDLTGLFTDAVTARRGGARRYAALLGLHAMLRPPSGWSGSSESAQVREDGSVVVALSVQHETPAAFAATTFGAGTRAADALVLRLVGEGDAWRVDTDLLALLEERVGSVDELVRPLSEQQRW